MPSEQQVIFALKDIAEGMREAQIRQDAALHRMEEILAAYERDVNKMLEDMQKKEDEKLLGEVLPLVAERN